MLTLALTFPPILVEAANLSIGIEYDVKASSELQSSKILYSATNLIPPSLGSAWCEGVDGDGVGEWLDLSLKEQIAGKEDLAIEIVPGYAKSGLLFLKNGRPRRIAVEVDGVAQETSLVLEDRAVVQSFTLKGSAKLVGKIRLKILEVYEGKQYSDTCISEISVKRLPKAKWDESLAKKESRMLVDAGFYDENSALQKNKFDTNSLEFAMRLADGMYVRGSEGRETLKELYLDSLIIKPQIFLWVLDKQKDVVFDMVSHAIVSPVNDKYPDSQIRSSILQGLSSLDRPLQSRWKPLLDAYSITEQ